MSLFDRACDLPASDQQVLLAEVRADDRALADDLGALLAQDEKTGDLLDSRDGRIDIDALAAAGDALDTASAIATTAGAGTPDTDSASDDTHTLAGPSAPRAAQDAKPDARPDPNIGAVIAGRYQLEQWIGAGGMGRVYRARDQRDGGDVAVKLLRADLTYDTRQVQRFRREFRAVARIEHPGCLNVFSEGSHDGQRYIVMEYVPGGNLGRLVGASADILLPVLVQLASALACIHGHRIIHRDIKPANVLLAAGDPLTPKLADFGIVKLIDEDSTRLTETGAVLGTIDYVAPELLDSAAPDPRSDLYSLGCVIYELWAGQPPFLGTPLQRLRARIANPAPPLRAAAPHAPEAIERLVASLLERDPSARPQRAADVARTLADLWAEQSDSRDPDQIIRSLPVAGPGGFLYRPGLIGREPVIADLMSHVDAAASGADTKLIAVCGPAGVGKSALTADLSRRLAERGVHTITAARQSVALTPFAPFPRLLERLGAALRASADSGPADQRPNSGTVSEHGDESDSARIFDVPLDDGAVAQRQLAVAIAERLVALQQRQPTVLIIEDLHDVEASAVALLIELASQLVQDPPAAGRPVLITTLRPSARAELMAAAHAPEDIALIDLDPLDSAAVGQIAAAMLAVARDALPEALTDHLSEACAGNPLLVQSAVRALVDGGHLQLRGAGWTLVTDTLPEALTDVLARILHNQLAALTPRTQAVLAVAALFGRRVEIGLLSEVAAISEEDALDAVDEAIRASVLRPRVRGEREGYWFEHQRLADVARESISVPERARYHHAIGAALERRGRSSLATLSFHFANSDDDRRAHRYLYRAGLEALRARDYQAAQRHLRGALDRVDALSEPNASAARADCTERLADAAIVGGQIDTGIQLLGQLTGAAQAGAPADAAAPRATRARWLRKLGVAQLRTPDVAAGLITLEQALAILGDHLPRGRLGVRWRTVRDIAMTALGRLWRRLSRRRPNADSASEERALIHRELAFMHRWINLDRAGAHLSAFIRLAHRLGKRAYLADAYVGSGFIYTMLTWTGLAARHHRRARELAEEDRDAYGLARLEAVCGGTETVLRGDASAAYDHFDKSVQLAESIGDRFLESLTCSQRGWGSLLLGHGASAAKDFARASALATELGIPWLLHDATSGGNLASLLRGDLETAASAARAQLGANINLALPVFEGLAIEILAGEAFMTGRFREAVLYSERARAHYQAHRLYDAWGQAVKLGYIEALLCQADEQGEAAPATLMAELKRELRHHRGRVHRLPTYRGYYQFLRGVRQSRVGNAAVARRWFAEARALRTDAMPVQVSTWLDARMAFEQLRLGDSPDYVRAALDDVDARYRASGLNAMRGWLAHMRGVHQL